MITLTKSLIKIGLNYYHQLIVVIRELLKLIHLKTYVHMYLKKINLKIEFIMY